MNSSPSSPSFTTPGPTCSTPNSGTFAASRTKLIYDSDQNKSKANPYKDVSAKSRRPSFSPGSLAEAAVSEKAKLRGKRHSQFSGVGDDLRQVGGAGAAVKPGQFKDWEVKKRMFYGPSTSSKADQWRKEISVKQKAKTSSKELDAKINRLSCKDLRNSNFGSGDFNLNFSESEEADLLDTIDLSSSPSTTPPPLLPQQVVLPHSIGFKNYGNTCYMNASIQALLGLNVVVTDVLNTRLVMDISSKECDKGLLYAFRQLCLAYNKGDGEWANQEMKELKKVMELLDKQFIGNKMQDASEFLCRFMDELNEDLIKSTRIELRRVDVMEKSEVVDGNIVHNNFLHKKEELLVCCDCKTQTSFKSGDMAIWCDTVSSINLNRTRSMSLQKLVDQSLSEEVRDRRCDKCGCEKAITTSRLVKLPKVLVIILKRYKYNLQDLTSSGKTSRLVDIPQTVCLTSLVSETVSLPSTSLPVLSPQQTHVQVQVPPPTTPSKMAHAAPTPETPTKFKGMTEEQLRHLSEEDQLLYLLFLSEKEALAIKSTRGDDEDEDLKAALEASMRDETFNQPESGQFEDATVSDKVNYSGAQLRTPARKRSYEQLGGGVFSHGDGEKLVKAMDYCDTKEVKTTSTGVKVDKKTYSKAVRAGKDKDRHDIIAVPRPTSMQQEEDDLKRGLELSKQELERTLQEDTLDNQFQWAMEDTENNNMEEVTSSIPGKPEHSYQLHSVVSHHGASASSGHYVVDVFRFDGGGWFRYDDTRVTKTDSETVRTGSNCANGYILTYLYQPLWEESQRVADQKKNIAKSSV